MQPKRLCICFGTQFEKTFENLLWKKDVKMQSMWQCICSDRQFANIWKLTPEKSCTIATNATLHLFWQAIWEDVWKLTLEKNRSNSTNETMNLFWQAVSEDTWKLTPEHSWGVPIAESTKKILPKTGARKTVLPVASEAIRCWPMLRRVVTFRRLSKTF